MHLRVFFMYLAGGSSGVVPCVAHLYKGISLTSLRVQEFRREGKLVNTGTCELVNY